MVSAKDSYNIEYIWYDLQYTVYECYMNDIDRRSHYLFIYPKCSVFLNLARCDCEVFDQFDPQNLRIRWPLWPGDVPGSGAIHGTWGPSKIWGLWHLVFVQFPHPSHPLLRCNLEIWDFYIFEGIYIWIYIISGFWSSIQPFLSCLRWWSWHFMCFTYLHLLPWSIDCLPGPLRASFTRVCDAW